MHDSHAHTAARLNTIAWMSALACVAALAGLACVSIVHAVALNGLTGTITFFAPALSDLLAGVAATASVGAATCLFTAWRRKLPTLRCKRGFGTCAAAWMLVVLLGGLGAITAESERWFRLAHADRGTQRFHLLRDSGARSSRRYFLATRVGSSPIHETVRLLGELPEISRRDGRQASVIARLRKAAQGFDDFKAAAEALLPEAQADPRWSDTTD